MLIFSSQHVLFFFFSMPSATAKSSREGEEFELRNLTSIKRQSRYAPGLHTMMFIVGKGTWLLPVMRCGFVLRPRLLITLMITMGWHGTTGSQSTSRPYDDARRITNALTHTLDSYHTREHLYLHHNATIQFVRRSRRSKRRNSFSGNAHRN